MGPKESKVMELLKKAGATKCYVSPGFDFEEDYPNGEILVDQCNIDGTIGEIYKMYTKDPDGWIDDDQSLLIMAMPGYNMEWNKEIV